MNRSQVSHSVPLSQEKWKISKISLCLDEALKPRQDRFVSRLQLFAGENNTPGTRVRIEHELRQVLNEVLRNAHVRQLYKVVCDETNNPPEVRATGKLVACILPVDEKTRAREDQH